MTLKDLKTSALNWYSLKTINNYTFLFPFPFYSLVLQFGLKLA